MTDMESVLELSLGLGRERPPSQVPMAFLVDGDNASASLVREMLAEASKYGPVIVRRVYGDWSSENMARWTEVLQEHALVPVQQFANVPRKNATDSALIIEAMDLLHGGIVKGFCLVSSDSDFTRLATRIREAGFFVMGIGEPKTPDSLRRACDVFVLTENLKPAEIVHAATSRKGGSKTRDEGPSLVGALKFLQPAFDNVVKDDELAHMSAFAIALRRLDPSFDPRTYGKQKLVDLVEALPDYFEVERRPEFGPGAVYVRRKREK